MKCPICNTETLRSRITRQGVEVDHCDSCGGIWMDEGEIFHFTKQHRALTQALERGRSHARPSTQNSPKTNQPMQEIPLLGLVIDICPTTKGLWFEGKEVKQLRNTSLFSPIQFDTSTKKEAVASEALAIDERYQIRWEKAAEDLQGRSNLYFRSTVALALLNALMIVRLLL